MVDTQGIAQRGGHWLLYLTLTSILSRQGRGKIEKPLPSREMSSLSQESHLLIPLSPPRERVRVRGLYLSPLRGRELE